MKPSLTPIPISAVCDDACTLVQHINHRDPTLAMLAYGETSGCFEKPCATQKPRRDIDVPDILPLAHVEDPRVVPTAMQNQSPLIHPDVRGTRRYIMGTKFQMRESGKSHKKPTCSFHDVNNAKQGCLIKTMNQEALQVERQGVILFFRSFGSKSIL